MSARVHVLAEQAFAPQVDRHLRPVLSVPCSDQLAYVWTGHAAAAHRARLQAMFAAARDEHVWLDDLVAAFGAPSTIEPAAERLVGTPPDGVTRLIARARAAREKFGLPPE